MDNIERQLEQELCELHKQKVEFICGVNEWHCEGLCVECIPSHTQKHNANKLQTNIQKIDSFKQDCQSKVDSYVQNIQKTKSDFRELVNQYPIDDRNLINLKKWRQYTIDQVNLAYDYFEKEYLSIYNKVYSQQKNLFDQIFELIQKEEDDFKPLVGSINNIKSMRMTFKKNFEEKYKDILDKIKQATSLKVTEQLNFSDENSEKLNKLLPTLVTSIQDQNQQKVKEVQQQKRKQINTEKQHFCPDCGSQMNYVSDFKKHLVCPECVKVKRPNVLPHNKFGSISTNNKQTKKI